MNRKKRIALTILKILGVLVVFAAGVILIKRDFSNILWFMGVMLAMVSAILISFPLKSLTKLLMSQ